MTMYSQNQIITTLFIAIYTPVSFSDSTMGLLKV